MPEGVEISENEYINSIPFIKTYNAFKDVDFVLGDFELVGNQIIKNLKDFTILTNIPFGIRSKKELTENDHMKLYKRFSLFLRKNMNLLRDVYILYPRRDKFRNDEFFPVSGLKWEAIQEFKLGGVPIALYKLKIEESRAEKKYELVFREENFPKSNLKIKIFFNNNK